MRQIRGLFADTAPLRVPAFRRLWLASIVTVIGAQLTVVAVPAQLYSMTGSSAWVGLSGAFGLVPLIIFGLWGGALADQFDRRLLLILTTAGLILTSGCFWLQAHLGNVSPWLLLTLFSLQQACFALNQPVRNAILPSLLPSGQLAPAMALNMTVFVGGAVAGPLVGGMLIPVIGLEWLYLIDTVTLFATLGAVIGLPRGAATAAPASVSAGIGLRAVWDGLRYLAGHPVLVMSFAVDLVAMVFGMPRALFPEIAHRQFGGPPEGGTVFAWLYAAIPVGALIGGIFSGWVARVDRQGRAVVWAVAAWGIAIICFGGAAALGPRWWGPALVLALVSLMVAGGADMASAAFRQAMLLHAADDAVRGRLQGIFSVVVVGGPNIADLAHGFAGGVVGAPAATIGGGVLVLACLVVLTSTIPAFWRFRLSADRS